MVGNYYYSNSIEDGWGFTEFHADSSEKYEELIKWLVDDGR
jgi:hypothetical protein